MGKTKTLDPNGNYPSYFKFMCDKHNWFYEYTKISETGTNKQIITLKISSSIQLKQLILMPLQASNSYWFLLRKWNGKHLLTMNYQRSKAIKTPESYLTNTDTSPLYPSIAWKAEAMIIAPCSSFIICLNFCMLNDSLKSFKNSTE